MNVSKLITVLDMRFVIHLKANYFRFSLKLPGISFYYKTEISFIAFRNRNGLFIEYNSVWALK